MMNNLKGWFNSGVVWKQNGRWLGWVVSNPSHVIFANKFDITPRNKLKIIFGVKYIQSKEKQKKLVLFGQQYKQIEGEQKEKVLFGQHYFTKQPKPKEKVLFGQHYFTKQPKPKEKVLFGSEWRYEFYGSII